MKQIRQKKSAFTLVEIMIVVVIIGLLASMAIPAFQKVRSGAQQKAALNNLRQLAAAGQQYLLDQGVTTANYTSIVHSTATTAYLRTIKPVAGESYTGLVVRTSGNLTVSVGGVTVTYTY
ncbi:MAG: hypothetical protein A2007_01410 [Verrucomicrobia bacterium GWC2_42_7]|nr:MAG: hypothetical protein A2007_01410 [Verrucomicrobia bacterium GWC2_42_7]